VKDIEEELYERFESDERFKKMTLNYKEERDIVMKEIVKKCLY
jgi:hypothetical protein